MERVAAQAVVEEMARWRLGYEQGGIRLRGLHLDLGDGEFYAAQVPSVGSLVLHPGAATSASAVQGAAIATNDRLMLASNSRTIVAQWGWETVSALRLLPDGTGVVMMIFAGEVQAIVLNCVAPHPASPADLAAQRIGWLQVEATFSASHGELARFFSTLPERLAALHGPL